MLYKDRPKYRPRNPRTALVLCLNFVLFLFLFLCCFVLFVLGHLLSFITSELGPTSTLDDLTESLTVVLKSKENSILPKMTGKTLLYLHVSLLITRMFLLLA